MKKLLVGFLALVAVNAEAQTVQKDLVGLGMEPEVADYLADIIPAGAALDNNVYLKANNQAGSADVNLIKLDTSDNTVINSSASDVLILQLEDDASRLINFSAASDAALAMTFGDAGTTATQILTLSASTSDADDDSSFRLAGGGAFGTDGTRGATIVIPGEEVSGGSDITYNAGASDTHIFQVAGSTVFTMNGTGELIGAGTATLGWTVVAGANAACSTTCTTPCVFGVNTAATEADIVACSDATADECLCAGAS